MGRIGGTSRGAAGGRHCTHWLGADHRLETDKVDGTVADEAAVVHGADLILEEVQHAEEEVALGLQCLLAAPGDGQVRQRGDL